MPRPHHDAVAAAARSWYTSAFPEMGWECEERRFGYYRRKAKAPTSPRVVARNLSDATVPAFVRDIEEYFGREAPIYVDLEDRYAAAKLRPALEQSGLKFDSRQIFLAHVGPVPDAPAIPGLTVEGVGPDGLYEYEETRLRGFADSEDPRAPQEVEMRVRLRLAETNGGAQYWLARIDGEPAAAMSWYEGDDRWVFSLATRVPYRRRGIARFLLCRIIRQSYEAGRRSVIITANEDGTPVQIYRRLGFTDEVYWHAEFVLRAAE